MSEVVRRIKPPCSFFLNLIKKLQFSKCADPESHDEYHFDDIIHVRINESIPKEDYDNKQLQFKAIIAKCPFLHSERFQLLIFCTPVNIINSNWFVTF